MNNESFLRVDRLSKRFGGLMAIHDVSFELRQGDLLGLIGPNGSGKTTLVNLITGFVKPDSGKVIYQGKNITGLVPYKIACLGIARTFQMVRPFYQLPAFKNLIIPLYSPRVRKMKGGKYGKRGDVAVDLLEEVGFERDSYVPYKPAGSLPHGYLKRMELAQCMALRPEILILDELFSGMTMSEVASTIPIIERLKSEGKTIMMIEHRWWELARIASSVIVLDFGTKIAEGAPKDVLNNEAVKKAYLGSEVVEE